ncbi:MAG: glycosyltransferase family 4 protein [Flavicella sp.]
MREFLIFFILYKWKYRIAQIKAWLLFEKTNTEITSLTYVAREADKKWIFGAQIRRLSGFSKLNAQPYFHAKLRNLPKSDGYFFIFPNYFCRAIRHNPFILNRKNIVMYTHANWTSSYSKTHVIWCLKRAHKIICLNTTTKKQLIDLGIREKKIQILHIASNPDMFSPHDRKGGAVGFCAAFSKRKNPDLLYKIVKNMPEKEFFLIGTKWEHYDKFKMLNSLSNFTYIADAPYESYPDWYAKIDTYVSTSFLEGGPVPLLEAMLSNCVPVVSNTGFCSDIVEHGKNGFLFDPHADVHEVIALIRDADKLQTSTRESAVPHSWKNCSLTIDRLFLEN